MTKDKPKAPLLMFSDGDPLPICLECNKRVDIAIYGSDYQLVYAAHNGRRSLLYADVERLTIKCHGVEWTALVDKQEN